MKSLGFELKLLTILEDPVCEDLPILDMRAAGDVLSIKLAIEKHGL